VSLRKANLAALLAAVSLIPAGCGDSEGDSSGATATTTQQTEETTTETEKAATDPREVVQRIDRLLDRAVRAYDPAAPDAAGELVAEAYVENYEDIEDGVKSADAELNASIEPLLGAELRKRIREGAPPAEIEAMADRAKRLLDQAVPALVKAE
jgi:hypothetical protein